MSGPAASVVGARALAGLDDAFISDIGGTTTDIALIEDGRPLLSRDGAQVGDFRTMVEAVSVHTSGLGGDSELNLDERGRLVAGPRRAVPLSLLGTSHPKMLAELQRQVDRGYAAQWDGQFAMRQRALDTALETMSSSQQRLWERLADGPVPLTALYEAETPTLALRRLTGRGLVILSRLTPSDAAHLLGRQSTWDPRGAELGAHLWLRQWQASGHRAPGDVQAFCEAVCDAVVRQSARALLAAAVAEEYGQALPTGRAADILVDGPISGEPGRLVGLKVELRYPIVAIGAPAATYYAQVGGRLGTTAVVPEHAEVCNAVGAVAGGVSQRVDALITSPREGRYRCHLPEGIADFRDLDAAAEHAGAVISEAACRLAEDAGAVDVTLSTRRDDNVVRGADGLETFIESRLRATATGRPRLASV
jgi:N-methylhydantoinase A/oxoprolinase/acetone carboxylase beta subunit